MGGLPQWKLLDEERGDERDSDYRKPAMNTGCSASASPCRMPAAIAGGR